MSRAPDDLRSAYTRRQLDADAPAISEVERAQLVETFLAVGPHAPTLSGDWDTHHLVAHLVLRESNPIGALKSAIPKVGGQAVERLVAAATYEHLVEQFRVGPPALSFFQLPGSDRRLNALEHYVHHEDVRRAQPGWTARDLPTWAQDGLWTPLRWFAKGITRHSAVPLHLARADTGEESVARKGDNPVVVRGLPSELALFVYGRSEVAKVDLDGDSQRVEAVRRKRFRL